jgi:hypothetical protein
LRYCNVANVEAAESVAAPSVPEPRHQMMPNSANKRVLIVCRVLPQATHARFAIDIDQKQGNRMLNSRHVLKLGAAATLVAFEARRPRATVSGECERISVPRSRCSPRHLRLLCPPLTRSGP